MMMSPALSLRLRSFVLALSAAAPLALPSAGRAQDGTWISQDATNLWSDSTNWSLGTIADGTDATVKLTFFPYVTGNGATADQGANVQLDSSRTIGHLVFEDLDNFGSSSIGMQNPAAATTLTFDASAGVPTVLTGQNLNSVFGGKKAIIPNIIGGSDGLRKAGPGFLGIRAFNASTAHTWSGDFQIDGGLVELAAQTVYTGATAVRGGSTLFLNFTNANAPATNPVNTASVLTLGSSGSDGGTRGGGVLINSNKAAPSNAAQAFAATTINEGVHEVRAVSAANQNITYSLGALSRNPHSTLHFARSATAGTAVINASAANGANGIIGAWATYATGAGNVIDWAVNNGADQIGSFGGYTNDVYTAGTHTNVTLDATLAAATVESLKLNTGSGVTVNLSGTSTIQSGGLLAVQQSPALNGGILTTGDSNGDFYLHSYAGGLGPRISSVFADNGAPVRLIKAGTGAVTLTGASTHTGGTYIGAGSVVLGNGFGGGSSGSLPGDIFLNAFNNASGSFSPSGTLVMNRAGTYVLPNTLTGSGNLAQYSTGTLVLDKQQGMRSLQAFAGAVKLDFAAPAAPAAELISSIDTAGTASLATGHLQMRNSRLEIAGRDGTANVQSFGLTSVYGAARIVAAAGTGGSLQLNLGALGRYHNSAEGGATLRIDAGAGVTVTAPNGGTPGQSAQNGPVLDFSIPWVTWGDSDWAAKDTTPVTGDLPASSLNIISAGSIPGFYTATSSGALTGNADVDNSPEVAGATSISSLRFNAAAAHTVTVNAPFEPRGILVTPNVGANDVMLAGNGSITTNYIANNIARDLNIIQNNTAGRLVIAAPVTNGVSGTNITRTTVVKSGAGDLVFTGATHTYTDRTLVNEGRLILSTSAVLGTSAARSGSILTRGGEVVLEDNAQVYTGGYHSSGQRAGETGILTIKGNSLFDISADFNFGDVWAKGILNLEDSARAVVKSLYVGKNGFAEGVVNLSGESILIAGNTPSADWNLGGNGGGDPSAKGTVNQSGSSTFDTGNQNFQVGRYGAGEFNLSGGSYRGTGWNVIGRFHSGVGTWNVSGGTLDTTSTNAVAPAVKEYLIIGEEGRGTLNVSGSGIVTARSLSLGHNGGIGELNVSGGTVDLTATGNLTNTQAGIVFAAGNTAPAFYLAGGPAGTVNLNGGVVKLNAISERAGANVASTVNFDGGTIQAIASNPAFMGGLDLVAVKAGGGTINTGGFDVTVTQSIRTGVELNGVNGTRGAAVDGGLTKAGAGTLTLAAAQFFTGPLTVTGGTVINEQALAGGATIAPGATLTGAGAIDGPVLNNGTMVFDHGGTVVMEGPVVNNGTILLKNNTTLIVTGAVTNTGAIYTLGGTFTAGSLAGLPVTGDIKVTGHGPAGADYSVTVESVAGYTYLFETATQLNAGSWTAAAAGQAGTGAPLTFTHPGGAGQSRRFYRVRVQ